MVRDLQSRGVHFWLDNDHVRFRGRGKPVNSKDVEYLKQHKGEVVEFLSSSDHHGSTLPCTSHPAQPSAGANGETPVSAQLDRFREKAAAFEECDDLPRARAVWLAALSAFVLPSEREEYFDGDDNLTQPRVQLCLAVGEGLTVTFHQNGRVSFHNAGIQGEVAK